MKIALTLLAAALTSAPIAFAAVAHAETDYQMFQSPSGNIHCHLDSTRPEPIAMCQVNGYTYQRPPASAATCPRGSEPGRTFRLDQGQTAQFACDYAALDSGYSGPWTTLAYGETRSAGTITCDSEPTGMACTDSSTGHFFRVSREGYQLG